MGDIDDKMRGIANKGLDARGASLASASSRAASASAAVPRARVAQAARAGTTALPAANHRTIFVVNTKKFHSLPKDVRDIAIKEVEDIYAFVGNGGRKAMTVLVLDEANFPAAYAMSDAVVSIVSSGSDLQAHLNQALQTQGSTFVDDMDQRGMRAQNPFAQRTAAVVERNGSSSAAKQVIRAGGNQFALPFMAAAVAVNSVIDDVLTEVQATIDPARTSKTLNTRYWASSQALADTRKTAALENPGDPSAWSATERELLGLALGRAIAHEARHLYLMPHANIGLGSSGALVIGNKQDERFSAQDETDFLAELTRLESLHRGATLVELNPPARVQFGFPF